MCSFGSSQDGGKPVSDLVCPVWVMHLHLPAQLHRDVINDLGNLGREDAKGESSQTASASLSQQGLIGFVFLVVLILTAGGY